MPADKKEKRKQSVMGYLLSSFHIRLSNIESMV